MGVKLSLGVSLGAVLAIVLVALVGAQVSSLQPIFGIFVPYAAFVIFILGFIYRVVDWGRSPVPYRIPTTCGQQKTLPWIKNDEIENPSSTLGVIGRMILEIFAFRSLFRHTKAEMASGNIVCGGSKWIWLGALAFHYSFLIIAIRHLRLFVEPVPAFVNGLGIVDGMLQIGVPELYITDVLLLAAVSYLLVRRLIVPKMRYISLANDYFPLFLILGIGISGVLMRYFIRVDIVSAKELAVGLASLHPTVPEGIGAIFFVHVALVSTLFAYFPFSKLMHAGGVFLSPGRNLANTNRAKMHVNPWEYPVKIHPYEDYENEFREKMKNAGIPVERE
ncbi:MAG: sulfate reduction electron transfer complex DsrMKJOP subunit DsrM [Deltaproteobacteria bacterium]|nr:sulfate reduction electron transfer complex DsrMKJOP subunit DsrM [Deltaproteobacteria bacterium]MBW1967440.1 sulfate reduction electron transfer complex DsrMKJOP subunit DsrM [Deltaproteobacteria bacterium]MBW2098735.1 sulfate reduction electron transfer complex DsrMKJOP subunit DsrM [Deltaproteobacteria bacterium]